MRINPKLATKLLQSFSHAWDADPEERNAISILVRKHILFKSLPVIGNGQASIHFINVHLNFRSGASRVLMDIRKTLLNDSKECQLDFLGQSSCKWGDVDGHVNSAPL